jgi:DNA-binding NarL/FixJ family response regulator
MANDRHAPLPAEITQVIERFAAEHSLTAREREVLRLACKGWKNLQIAHQLHRSRFTVRLHLRNLYKKTGTSDKAELVMALWRWSLLNEKHAAS